MASQSARQNTAQSARPTRPVSSLSSTPATAQQSQPATGKYMAQLLLAAAQSLERNSPSPRQL